MDEVKEEQIVSGEMILKSEISNGAPPPITPDAEGNGGGGAQPNNGNGNNGTGDGNNGTGDDSGSGSGNKPSGGGSQPSKNKPSHQTKEREAPELEDVEETTTAATETQQVETTETIAVEVQENSPEKDNSFLGGGLGSWWLIPVLMVLTALMTIILVKMYSNHQKKKEAERRRRERRAAQRSSRGSASNRSSQKSGGSKPAPAKSPRPAAPAPVPMEPIEERTEINEDAIPAAIPAAPVNPGIPVMQPVSGMRSATFQDIGARKDQQDSYGMTDPALYAQQGVLGLVADGMGGLANGKAVSSALVSTFLGGYPSVMNRGEPQDQLMELAIAANQRVNQMLLGADRSGSTLVSVVIRDGRLHFLTVGDSRIYLYRAGALLQLNREHIYQEELAVKAVNSQVHPSQVTADRQAHSLTSFFGIGVIPHMDRNFEGIRLVEGDRILLCSDGVFGTLTQDQMEYALDQEDVREAAQVMRDMILDIHKPYQDNNTGMILEYLG